MKEIAEYDSQFKYWNSRSKEENEIYPKYYETNIDLEIPGIQHGYLEEIVELKCIKMKLMVEEKC